MLKPRRVWNLGKAKDEFYKDYGIRSPSRRELNDFAKARNARIIKGAGRRN